MMKILVVLSITLSLGIATPMNNKFVPVESLESRIIDGNVAASGQFPWQVAVRFSDITGSWLFCGGSLISDQWVLTAGHCASGATNFTVELGLVQLNSTNKITAQVETAVVHENFSIDTLEDDIALLKLASPVILSETIQPITLGSNFTDGQVNVTVSGWGITYDDSNSVSNSLNYVELHTITNEECGRIYTGLIKPGMICCRGQGEKSPCNGDSGGPLIDTSGNVPIHVGVVSFVSAVGCESGYPTGYTRTSEYRDWITQVSGI